MASSEVGDEIFGKPGQRKPTPSPADGTRVYYESLRCQKPDSYLAIKWCVEYGVCPPQLGLSHFEQAEMLKKLKLERKSAGLR